MGDVQMILSITAALWPLPGFGGLPLLELAWGQWVLLAPMDPGRGFNF